MRNEIRTIVVDDNETVRDGMSALINGTEGYQCVASFSNCESLLNQIDRYWADVILMDIRLPGISGIEGARRIKQKFPQANILMLTVYEENDLIFDAICAGASGYLLKRMPPARLLEAVREAYEGGSPMNSRIARRLLTMIQEKNVRPPLEEGEPFGEREKNILIRLAQGETYEEIAQQIFISANTVKYYVRKIYQKLHASSKSEAISKAIRAGLI